MGWLAPSFFWPSLSNLAKSANAKVLEKVDFLNVNPTKWTNDPESSDQVRMILHNFGIKNNDLGGNYKRKKFALQVRDESPAGIVQIA